MTGVTAVDRLPAEAKLVATVGFAVVVVATPSRAWPAFVVHALLLVAVAAIARVPPRWALPRLAVELPFVAFAVALPFVALGERVPVGPLSLSLPGLEAAALVIVRATLGVGAAVVLAATTTAPDLLAGLTRLRAPGAVVGILGAMVRYGGIVGDDARRMAVARASRGAGAGVRAGWRAGGAALGRLFVRSYERGERVQLAMASRGHPGVRRPAPPAGRLGDWLVSLALPAAAALATAVAL